MPRPGGKEAEDQRPTKAQINAAKGSLRVPGKGGVTEQPGLGWLFGGSRRKPIK